MSVDLRRRPSDDDVGSMARLCVALAERAAVLPPPHAEAKPNPSPASEPAGYRGPSPARMRARVQSREVPADREDPNLYPESSFAGSVATQFGCTVLAAGALLVAAFWLMLAMHGCR